MKRYNVWLTVTLVLSSASSHLHPNDSLPYHSPLEVDFSPHGDRLALTDYTAGTLTIVDVEKAAVIRTTKLDGRPTGLTWTEDGKRLFVAEYDASTVAAIVAETGRVDRRFNVGLRPMGVVTAPGKSLLITAVTATDEVSIIDSSSGEEKARIRVPREPHFVAVNPKETLAVVGNLLPAGSAEDPQLASVVSLIDLDQLAIVANVKLPAGSTSLRQVTVSPDGHWAYVAHTLGRFNVPATQLGRGWVNTNALSVIDLRTREHHTTVLLDHPYEGAADPWGLALSPGGDQLWISLRGVHRLARLNIAKLHALLAGESKSSSSTTGGYGPGTYDVWQKIRKDPSHRKALVNDLGALHVAEVIERVPLPGKGPRGLDISPDGKRLAVAMYYSGSIVLADAASGKATATVCLGPSREPDLARRGEEIFHDADVCFQRWMSCSTCHPDNGRTDGLRWDLMNDGLGTPQRTRSLLMSYRIRPTTSRGARGGIEESVPKGLLFLRHLPEPELTEPLIAYLQSLEPEPSPYLVDGELSTAAKRGEELFHGKAKCSRCHRGELGTDLKAHDVGTRGEFDRPDDVFYTPKLIELFRTAPFLHDGRAATLKEVLTKHNPQGLHGNVAELSSSEVDDLIEYLNSL